VHACRDWRGRLVIYDDVDISTLIEIEQNGKKIPVGHIVRAANDKTVRQIHDEIRESQREPSRESNVRRLMAIASIPGFSRRLFLRLVDKSPRLTKKYKGTAVLTSVGMFGSGAGWGLALPTHSLGITVGGIAEKPRFVDGAPAARFAQRFAEMVEAGDALE
jgi:pyruvate/2-oxoglutarate dehydrogenase complex dihydrolipoamide acyltransferase (E2) component